jgi:hypothetical protein
MVVPKLTEKGHFLYQRIFADEKFVAAGQVVIPANGEKPKKSSKDNTYVSPSISIWNLFNTHSGILSYRRCDTCHCS